MSKHVCTCGDCASEAFEDRCKHEAENERLRYAVMDARSFVLSIQRHESDWENQATGLLSRLNGVLGE